MNIQQIADRAEQLIGLHTHGVACFLACQEAGIVNGEVAATAELVSCELINREMAAWRAAGGPEAMAREEKKHEEARKIVSAWAKANGRTGRKHAQSRQQRIRSIMKHGLQSDYAAKIMAETKHSRM